MAYWCGRAHSGTVPAYPRGFVNRGAQVGRHSRRLRFGVMAWGGAASLGRGAEHAVHGDCAVVRRHAAMLWTGSDCVTESRCDRCLYPGECDLRCSRRCLISSWQWDRQRMYVFSAAAWAYKVESAPARASRGDVFGSFVRCLCRSCSLSFFVTFSWPARSIRAWIRRRAGS